MLPRKLPILIIFLLAFAATLTAAVAYPKPVGADIVFHLDIVQAYLRGENGMFAPHVMAINRIPYPPLFHMLLLPSVALGFGNSFILALQVVMYPLCLLFAMLLAEKYGYGLKHAVIVGAALLGSSAFLDATFQIRPETLDILLWLVFLYAVLSFKGKLGVASVVAGVYNHSLPSLVANGGIILHEHNWKKIAVILAASSPIIVVSVVYMGGMLGRWVGSPASPQAAAFMGNWPAFTFNYLGSLLVGLPIAFYAAYKWKTLNNLAKFSLLTIASSLLLLPVWYDRYYQYISVPLAFLIGDFLATRKGKLWLLPTAYIIFYIVVFAALGYGSLWLSNLAGGWDIH